MDIRDSSFALAPGVATPTEGPFIAIVYSSSNLRYHTCVYIAGNFQ